MPEEVSVCWPCYRLVDKKWCSLAELEYGHTGLTINDVDLAIMAINAKEDALSKARRRK